MQTTPQRADVDLGSFPSMDAASAAWQAAKLPPGQIAAVTIGRNSFFIMDGGQFVMRPRTLNSSAGERPPR